LCGSYPVAVGLLILAETRGLNDQKVRVPLTVNSPVFVAFDALPSSESLPEAPANLPVPPLNVSFPENATSPVTRSNVPPPTNTALSRSPLAARYVVVFEIRSGSVCPIGGPGAVTVWDVDPVVKPKCEKRQCESMWSCKGKMFGGEST